MGRVRRLRFGFAWLIQLAVVANLMLATLCCVPTFATETLSDGSQATVALCSSRAAKVPGKSSHGKDGSGAGHCFLCLQGWETERPVSANLSVLPQPSREGSLKAVPKSAVYSSADALRYDCPRGPPISI